MNCLAIPLAVAAVAASLHCQQLIPIGPDDDYVATSVRRWPASVQRTGWFRHAVCGRFTGHGIPDVVLLDDDQPILATAPDVHTTIAPLAGLGNAIATNDVATLVGAGEGPLRDGLLLVGPTGLRLWSRDKSAVIHVDPVAAPDFVGALQLATHARDASVVYGVAADACSVRIVEVGAQGLTQSPTVIRVPGAGAILAAVAVDWDGDGSADVAVLTEAGLFVFDRAGALLAECDYEVARGAYANPRRCLAAVRYANAGGRECVTWLAPKRTGPGSCLLIRGAEITNDPDSTDLGTTDYAGVAAADWSLSGQDDVLLTHASGDAVDVLVNANGLVSWLFVPQFGFRISVPAGAATFAPVATCDLDADGDADLVLAGGGPGVATSLVVVRSKPVDTPNLLGFDATLSPEGETRVLHFMWPAPPVPAAFASTPMVEAILWGVDSNGALDPYPVDRRVVQLMTPNTELDFLVPQGQSTFALMVRAVEVDAGQQVVAVGKAFRAQIVIQLNNGGGAIVPGIVPLPDLPPAPPSPPVPPVPGG
jgi:hypothetical protein